jgi:hypothetical protein
VVGDEAAGQRAADGVGWMFFADQVPDRAELCAAVLSIAQDIAEGG